MGQTKEEVVEWKKNELKNLIKTTLSNGGRKFSKSYHYAYIPWSLIQDVTNELKKLTDWTMTSYIGNSSNSGKYDVIVFFHLHQKKNIVILPESF